MGHYYLLFHTWESMFVKYQLFYGIRSFCDAAGDLGSPLPINCQGTADHIMPGTQHCQRGAQLAMLSCDF